ncbi:hypothetical protein IKG24_00325 [Candidatus Saccharibacteria bacterium]|nr:hypothetical protein [Candidatus Saccharibacteria bacterium]
MRKNFSNSTVPAFRRSSTIDFDTEKFVPSLESVKIYEELNAISEEIEKCRERNCQ